jgi:uncharacterized protein (TIGR03435 family)
MARISRITVVLVTVVCAGPVWTAQQAGPAFEVATIKRSDPKARGFRYGTQPGGRWVMENISIATLIRDAYPVQVRELVGAPDWVRSELYSVNAKADGDPTREQMMMMLRTLLADRFTLAAHYEYQERAVFSLVMARSDGWLGSNLLPSRVDCEAVNAARRAGREPDGPLPSNGAPPCAMTSNGEVMRMGGLPISELVEFLGQPDGRVVIDKTGLTGAYELTMRYRENPGPLNSPSLFTALEEQLGLKLVRDRAAVSVLVIDHIERPTPD